MPRAEMERRILKAVANPYTTMLGHPTGRLLLEREGYELDMARIIEAAAEHHVVMELNASPYRLDIDWRHMRQAKERGVMISINPDAHAAVGMHEMFYGLAVARKGWQEKDDVLNTRGTAEVKELFGRMRRDKGR
jgi:DNA polymerase (family 10)